MGDKPLSSDDIFQPSNSPLEKAGHEAELLYTDHHTTTDDDLTGGDGTVHLRAAPDTQGKLKPERGHAVGPAVEQELLATAARPAKETKGWVAIALNNTQVRKQKRNEEINARYFSQGPAVDLAAHYEEPKVVPKDLYTPKAQVDRPKLTLRPPPRSLEQIERELRDAVKSGKVKDIGRLLREYKGKGKSEGRVPHGQWLPWLERFASEADGSPGVRMLQIYMTATEEGD